MVWGCPESIKKTKERVHKNVKCFSKKYNTQGSMAKANEIVPQVSQPVKKLDMLQPIARSQPEIGEAKTNEPKRYPPSKDRKT